MASQDLDLMRRECGREYIAALERLGFRPDVAFWAFDKTRDTFILVIASDLLDYSGPFQMSQLLIKAYNASATPAQIDPFTVRTYSTRQAFIRDLRNWVQSAQNIQFKDQHGELITEQPERITIGYGDLEVEVGWLYRFDEPKGKLKTIDASRRWRRFQRNVEAIAA